MFMLIAILIPAVCGIILGFASDKFSKNAAYCFSVTTAGVTAVFTALVAAFGGEIRLFFFSRTMPFLLYADFAARMFTCLAAVLWLLTFLFSKVYMAHDEKENRFNAFLLLSLSAILGMGYAGNILSMYLCFEALTLLSLPLVLHNGTKKATSAAKKYLFYSIAGAFLALPAICYICCYAGDYTTFIGGGILSEMKIAGKEGPLLVLTFLAILGFGAKAGMFPLHAWLTSAHPESPAPASALLSGMIAKAGVFAVLRLVYFTVGVDYLTGSWVQYAWMIIALVTVFMGSMLALWEKNFKKRLAYSTISNLSYIMLGLSLLSEAGVVGAFMHLFAHAFAKVVLFFCAGAAMEKMGVIYVDDLRYWGKRMPITVWCFLLSGLSLIGIPPFAGFASKWFLCLAALDLPDLPLQLIAPAVLVLSALLTAGYLLPPALRGFFPPREDPPSPEELAPIREPLRMVLPMILLCVCSLLFGLFSSPIAEALEFFARTVI